MHRFYRLPLHRPASDGDQRSDIAHSQVQPCILHQKSRLVPCHNADGFEKSPEIHECGLMKIVIVKLAANINEGFAEAKRPIFAIAQITVG